MFKVYGLTFDHTTNYGSCFQAYALQSAIENMTIHGEHPSYFLIPIRTFRDYPSGTNFIKKILAEPFFCAHRAKFIPFEKKFMKYVSCKQMRDLPFLNKAADAFVCGSDVIWEPDYILNRKLGAFLLDFATKYKFSYAASFGKAEINKEAVDFVSEKLDSFDTISVREKTSLQIAKKCTTKKVEIVVDPVLLIEPEQWENILSNVSNKVKYIFVYTTHLNETFKSFIKKLRIMTGLKIIISVWNRSPKQMVKQGKLFIQSPEEWLSLLKHAEFVVTNSFHATVFSTIFHKKFFTVVNGDKAKGINMRMNDFLNTVGLEDRIYSSVPEVIDVSEIDYSRTDAVIARMRSESLAYLQRNLEEAYRQKMQQAKRRT